MKYLRVLIAILALSFSAPSYPNARHGYIQGFNGGKSQGQSWFLGEGEDYPFINLMKTASYTVIPAVGSLDANGYPTNASPTWQTLTYGPSQSERPGHQVLTWTGKGNVGIFYQVGGSGQTTVSCTGTAGGVPNCNNTACTAFTGGISGNTLTVTVASSCSLVVGQPIDGFVSSWGIPTFITAFVSGNGGTGTYTVNWAQTVAPGTSIQPGGRFEIAAGTENKQNLQWIVYIDTISVGSGVKNLAFMNVNDEATYHAGAELFGTEFKSRITQGGFGVWRFLDWSQQNVSNCTTWATRKPITYFSYQVDDLRPSLYTGDGSISYALNGSSNDYSVTFGTGAPVDKQTIIIPIPNSSTTTTMTLNLNGTGAVTIGDQGADNPPPSSAKFVSGSYASLVYDAGLNLWLARGGTSGGGNAGGLACGVPPEVEVQLANEMHFHPWFVMPFMAVDPMTDWVKQLATYVQANGASWMIPRFETPNESWQCGNGAFNGLYGSNKSFANWAANGPIFCGSHGDIPNWLGKVASTIGQDINSVYGNTSKYKVTVGVQTAAYASTTEFNNALASAAYLAQAAPAQSGYVKSAAKNWATGINVANYWSPGDIFLPASNPGQAEVADAWNWSISPTTAIMNQYVGTSSFVNFATIAADWSTFETGFSLSQMDAYEGGFNAAPASNDVFVSVTSASKASQAVIGATGNGAVAGMPVIISGVAGMTQLNNPSVSSPDAATFTSSSAAISATNTLLANQAMIFVGASLPSPFVQRTVYCVLSTGLSSSQFEVALPPGNGGNCTGSAVVAGSNGSASAYEAWFVSGQATNTITLNVNSTGFGTWTSGGSVDYIQSEIYINALRAASYSSQQAATTNTGVYNDFVNNGGEFPSMYNLAGGSAWSVWMPDIYGATASSTDPGTPQWQAICAYNGGSSC